MGGDALGLEASTDSGWGAAGVAMLVIASFSAVHVCFSVCIFCCCIESKRVRPAEGEAEAQRPPASQERPETLVVLSRSRAPPMRVDEDRGLVHVVRKNYYCLWAAGSAVAGALGGVSCVFADSAGRSDGAFAVVAVLGVAGAVVYGYTVLEQVGERIPALCSRPVSAGAASAALQRLTETAPEVFVEWECSHVAVVPVVAQEHAPAPTYQTVVSASGREPVPLAAWEDLSSPVEDVAALLGLHRRFATHLVVRTEVFARDDESVVALARALERVRQANAARDTHYAHRVVCGVPGAPGHLLLTSDQVRRPLWLHPPLFLLAVLAGLGWAYAICVHLFASADADFTLRKRVAIRDHAQAAPASEPRPGEAV
jgi:hypothetical protein